MNPLRSILSRAKRAFSAPLPAIRADELNVSWVTSAQIDAVARTFGGTAPGELIGALRVQDPSSIQIAAAFLAEQPVAVGYMHWPGHRAEGMRAKHPGEPEIFKLHVLHAQRSRGIGAVFLSFFEQQAKARGYTRVCLGVHAHNTRARTLYERCGYVADAQPYFDEYDEVDASGKIQHHRIAAVFLSKTL
jgi:GNAT superfamily N-acetyltransferase